MGTAFKSDLLMNWIQNHFERWFHNYAATHYATIKNILLSFKTQ